MAISKLGTSASYAYDLDGTFTVAKPSGVVENDLMVTAIHTQNATPFLIPTGWSLVTSQGGTNSQTYIYYKIAGASEPASYNWRLTSGTADIVGNLISSGYRGVDTSDPFGDIAGATSTTAESLSTGSLTVSSSTSWLVGFTACRHTGSSSCDGSEPAATLTEYSDGGDYDSAANFSRYMSLFDSGGPVSAGSVSKSFTRTGTTARHNVILLEILAGGEELEEEPADTEGLADALSLSQSAAEGEADSLGLADSLSLVQGHTEALTEDAELADNLTLAATGVLVISDTLGATDDLDIAKIIDPFTGDDESGLADNLSLAFTGAEVIADTAGLSDELVLSQTSIIEISDGVDQSDSVSAFDPSDAPVDLEDALRLYDATNVALSQANAISESAGTTDFITITLGYWEGDHVPHSSAGYGEIYIDRFFLVEKEKATEDNDGKMSLAGQESSPPTTPGLVNFLHGQINGVQRDKIVPVIFRDKASRNAYYSTGSFTSELTDEQGEVVKADWTAELTRQGSDSEIDLQSRLTGAVRQNDFSLTGQRWHAPAIGHYAYFTGSTIPAALTRTTSDGDMTVYMDVPANIHPKWGCAVEDYHTGRVRIKDTLETTLENEVEGLNRHISASGWSMTNGLVNVTPTATGGVINIANYNGTSFIDRYVNITVGGTGTANRVATWDAATILRNDFEQCIMRLTATAVGGGRVSVDIGLRRGARMVEGAIQTGASSTMSVHSAASESNQTDASASGYVTRSTDDTGGLRFACGSPRSFTKHSNGGVTKTSVTRLDFWFGATVGAGTTNDTAVDLRNQYIAAMPEHVYAVRR